MIQRQDIYKASKFSLLYISIDGVPYWGSKVELKWLERGQDKWLKEKHHILYFNDLILPQTKKRVPARWKIWVSFKPSLGPHKYSESTHTHTHMHTHSTHTGKPVCSDTAPLSLNCSEGPPWSAYFNNSTHMVQNSRENSAILNYTQSDSRQNDIHSSSRPLSVAFWALRVSDSMEWAWEEWLGAWPLFWLDIYFPQIVESVLTESLFWTVFFF